MNNNTTRIAVTKLETGMKVERKFSGQTCFVEVVEVERTGANVTYKLADNTRDTRHHSRTVAIEVSR